MNEAVQIERSTRISRLFAAFGLLLLLFLIIAPFYLGRSELYLLVEIFSYLALASLWNLLAGYTGLASVGQQGFVGLGGYSLFALTIFFRMPPILAVPAAGIVAALLAIPTAWIIFGSEAHTLPSVLGSLPRFIDWYLLRLARWELDPERVFLRR